jgi:hypothetical protein
MINSKDGLSTGPQSVTLGTPVSINILVDGYDFLVEGIASVYDTFNNYTFLLTQTVSRDQYSTLPICLDSYGVYTGSITGGVLGENVMYTRENGKGIFILKASSTINIKLFSNSATPGYCSLTLIGHYIDANGNPVIEGQYALPPALAAKL